MEKSLGSRNRKGTGRDLGKYSGKCRVFWRIADPTHHPTHHQDLKKLKKYIFETIIGLIIPIIIFFILTI